MSSASDDLWRTCDVVVVGSGAAGMAAALTAALAGLSVVLIERSTTFGGATAYSGGAIWIRANPLMAAELRAEITRVLDAFEDLVRATLKALGIDASPAATVAFVALADGFALHRVAARRDEQHDLAFREAFATLLDAYRTRS